MDNLEGLEGAVERLKPCPFCGSAGPSVHRPANGSAPFIICNACGGAGAKLAAAIADISAAVDAWNTRAEDPALTSLQARVKELGG